MVCCIDVLSTVSILSVAAECSYTYRNSSSPQHIDAQSSVLAQQGFQRCEFLIQLVSQQQQLQLNFTRLSGFALLPSAPSTHSHGQQEGQGKEEEEEGREGRGEGGGGHPQRQGLLTPGETDKGGEGSPASSVLSSPPGMKDTAAKNTTARTVYAKANHRTVSEHAPLMTSTTVAGTLAGRGRSCLPMVEIRTVVGRDGKEELEHRICGQHHPTQTPIVFHYASSVRIVYEWDLEHSSGFTLYFGFSASDKGERAFLMVVVVKF